MNEDEAGVRNAKAKASIKEAPGKTIGGPGIAAEGLAEKQAGAEDIWLPETPAPDGTTSNTA